LYPVVPMGPGRVQRREYEYLRHGTLGLTADLEVWCGWIIAPTLGPTRTEADFVAHVEQTVVTDPLAGWVFRSYAVMVRCPCCAGQLWRP
jgi:uncharacterized membrane protein YjdF